MLIAGFIPPIIILPFLLWGDIVFPNQKAAGWSRCVMKIASPIRAIRAIWTSEFATSKLQRQNDRFGGFMSSL
jgi:hypothetical protein